MSATRWILEPMWCGEDLGRPMPDSPHAVSVALPRWEDVVGYEEKKPSVMARLATGYPRFFLHPYVQELAGRMGQGRPCLPFATQRAARQAAAFVRRQSGAPAELVLWEGVPGVVTTAEGEAALRAFWQHAGLIVSSRRAAAVLDGRSPAVERVEVERSLRRQLARFYDCAEEDVFLTVTGMAAQALALEAVLARMPGRPTVQLGFPYVDTLKLQEKLGCGATLLHELDRVEPDLRTLLARQELAACFAEIPGNPLLGSVDLRRVTPLLREHGVPLVADDVVATPWNVDLGAHADLVATSLTKYIAGTGDVMGGAVICNPRSPYAGVLRPILRSLYEETLWPEDAAVIDREARGFAERMRRHNAGGLLVAERLRAHPAVERVWYPKWESAEGYDAVRRPEGGWGSLVTFLPRRAADTAPRVYDRLRLCKGPSLGTVFTLACPFTLLAHYTELEWAESCGVPRYLIRISVGIEEPEMVWRAVAEALDAGGAC